jgi:8-oxo-dGTP diphosphatase / 2-hydroxy-dATP diphosphatase
MKPSWFDLPSPEIDPLAVFKVLLEEDPEPGETTSSTVPFHKMWRDDILWMPFLISKRRFVGRVDLVDGASSDAENPFYPMVKWWFATIEE